MLFRQPAAPVSCIISQGCLSRQSYHCYHFLTSWLLCSLYKEVNYSKSRGTMETVYLHSFYQKLKGTDMGCRGRERMDVCMRDSCTLEKDAFSRYALCPCAAYWSACRPTLGITSSPAGLPMHKGWVGIQLWLKKSLLAVSDGQTKGEAHILLFAFAWRSCTSSPERNGS